MIGTEGIDICVIDDAEAGKEGSWLARQFLLVPCWERVWAGQEGAYPEGRLVYERGHAGCGPDG